MAGRVRAAGGARRTAVELLGRFALLGQSWPIRSAMGITSLSRKSPSWYRCVLERCEFYRGQTARVGQFESPGAGLVSALYSAECDELQPAKVTYVIA
jgi:hypothetical protein